MKQTNLEALRAAPLGSIVEKRNGKPCRPYSEGIWKGTLVECSEERARIKLAIRSESGEEIHIDDFCNWYANADDPEHGIIITPPEPREEPAAEPAEKTEAKVSECGRKPIINQYLRAAELLIRENRLTRELWDATVAAARAGL